LHQQHEKAAAAAVGGDCVYF